MVKVALVFSWLSYLLLKKITILVCNGSYTFMCTFTRAMKSDYLLEYLHVCSCERENGIEIAIRLNIFLLQISSFVFCFYSCSYRRETSVLDLSNCLLKITSFIFLFLFTQLWKRNKGFGFEYGT